MREATVINKKKLQEIYQGHQITVADTINSSGNVKDITNYDLEEFVVRQVARMGPFSTVQVHNVAGSTNLLIVPAGMIETKSVPSFIEPYIEVLETLMPSRWYFDSARQLLLLHYPELQLTNTLGLIHKIYDLVVSLAVRENTGLRMLRGRRYSWSSIELTHNYSHSHLTTEWDQLFNYKEFCVGGGSRFQSLLLSLDKVNTKSEFEMFLLQLEQYLSWESVEGGPYMYISDVLNGRQVNGDIGTPNLYSEDATLVAKLFMKQLPLFPILVASVSKMPAVFDPTLNKSGFYTLEAEVIKNLPSTFNSPTHLLDWDINKEQYVSGDAFSEEVELPEAEEDQDIDQDLDDKVITAFNITPRVVKVEMQRPTTVKRFSKGFLMQVVNKVNLYLMNGLKKVNEQGNNITV